jgi:hypothetical protein
MNLEEVALLLENKGQGIRGESIFLNEMPDTCKRGIQLMTRIGARIDHELIGYFDTEFMVIVRSTEYKDGYDLAVAVSKALTIYQPIMTDTMEIKQILPVATPRSYRRQVSGFWEFEFDVNMFSADL